MISVWWLVFLPAAWAMGFFAGHHYGVRAVMRILNDELHRAGDS